MKWSKFVYYGQSAAADKGDKIAQVVALAVAGQAKTTHRVGFGKITGNLQNAYQVIPQGPGQGAHVVNGMNYAVFIEFGTGSAANGGNTGIKPQAHLRNACQTIAQRYKEVQWVAANG